MKKKKKTARIPNHHCFSLCLNLAASTCSRGSSQKQRKSWIAKGCKRKSSGSSNFLFLFPNFHQHISSFFLCLNPLCRNHSLSEAVNHSNTRSCCFSPSLSLLFLSFLLFLFYFIFFFGLEDRSTIARFVFFPLITIIIGTVE